MRGERSELFKDTAVEDVVHRSQAHPVVRLNMAMTASDSPEGLRARLLEHLEDVYTDWHTPRRGSRH